MEPHVESASWRLHCPQCGLPCFTVGMIWGGVLPDERLFIGLHAASPLPQTQAPAQLSHKFLANQPLQQSPSLAHLNSENYPLGAGVLAPSWFARKILVPLGRVRA